MHKAWHPLTACARPCPACQPLARQCGCLFRLPGAAGSNQADLPEPDQAAFIYFRAFGP